MKSSSAFTAYFLEDRSLHRLKTMHPDPNEMVGIIEDFTKTYQSFSEKAIGDREIACWAIQLQGMVRPVESQDLFVGRMKQMAVGISAQSKQAGMGYCIHPDIDQLLISREELTQENRIKLGELLSFWEENGTTQKSRKLMPREVMDIIGSEYYYREPGIAFMLYRMSGIQLDYAKLIKLGVSGLKAEINRKIIASEDTEQSIYAGMLKALDLFTELCLVYTAHLNLIKAETSNIERRKELETMVEVLDHIAYYPPVSLRQALQLMLLYNRLDGTKNYGRMDDYLAAIYKKDQLNNALEDDEAIRLLSAVWQLMIARDNRYDTRLIIGGKGRIAEKYADKVALLILETTRRVKDIVPQVALRFYNGQNPALYHTAIDVLAEGNTFPMLYNDEVNLPAGCDAFQISKKESEHLIQYGCGEYVLNHRSVGTPSGVINLLQALIVTMNRGIDPVSLKPMGMPISRYPKYGQFDSFEQLWGAYKEQIEYHVSLLAWQEALEYQHAAMDNPYLYTSMLMDDCIARGKPVFDGGVRYLGGTLETYGNINTSDSLVAIKEWVYDKQAFTLQELTTILHENFEGSTKVRMQLRSSPKYGNDNEVADEMACLVHNHICNFAKAQAPKVGLDTYLVVVINNDANTIMGSFTPASPDGRKAFAPLNPGNNPTAGSDKNGVTALLNSLVKANTHIHAGAVQNLKFSKSMLGQNRPVFDTLMQTYFKNGGAQAMLTVVGRGDLEKAMEHPENYPNLIVRVGGFSERFINLPKATQLEVLSRTLN